MYVCAFEFACVMQKNYDVKFYLLRIMVLNKMGTVMYSILVAENLILLDNFVDITSWKLPGDQRAEMGRDQVDQRSNTGRLFLNAIHNP